jgi:hypothetical protein
MSMPGRAAISSPAEPPVMKLSDAGSTIPAGSATASVDAMLMKMK